MAEVTREEYARRFRAKLEGGGFDGPEGGTVWVWEGEGDAAQPASRQLSRTEAEAYLAELEEAASALLGGEWATAPECTLSPSCTNPAAYRVQWHMRFDPEERMEHLVCQPCLDAKPGLVVVTSVEAL